MDAKSTVLFNFPVGHGVCGRIPEVCSVPDRDGLLKPP
ncbi:Uncharacterised protein [Mycobacteroides abscessus subsp. abscessus]|nr:Uncharacterised protein [Mycobacteroides abscessus subsp. abscessus]